MISRYSSKFCFNKNNSFSKFIFGIGIFVALFAFSSNVYAATPTLTVVGTGNGDTVQMNVTGDPNVSVIFYYMRYGIGQQMAGLGNTDANGNFSTTISSANYGIASYSSVRVTLNGSNGPTSSVVSWPLVTTVGSGQLSLNQTSLVLSLGQTSSVVASNNGSSSLYVSNNSNPAIASINFSGNQINVTGNSYGSTNVTICTVGNSSSCPSLYVTVQSGNSQSLIFSQNNPNVLYGQSVLISLSGGNGYYTISNNSNSSVVQATINGSNVLLNAVGSSGTDSITICSTNMTTCGTLNVTVGGGSNSGGLTFSQSNPVLSIGQSIGISVYGGSGTSYYVSSNSNSNILQTSLINNILTVTGLSSGYSSLNICYTANQCGQVSVTVNGTSGGAAPILSQSNVTIAVNQTTSVSISGGIAPYSLPVSSNGIYQASISGTNLNVTGLGDGSSQISVCSISGSCSSLYITVSGTNSGQPTFSQNNLSLLVGQNSTISIYGNGSYYISSNSSSAVATAVVVGNSIMVSAVASGNTSISVCQTGSQCGTLYVAVATVNNSNTSSVFLNVDKTNISFSSGQTITTNISGGNGSGYSVSYNSNSNVVSPSINGNTLSLIGIRNGSAIVVVCDSLSNCASVPVLVGTTGPVYSAASPIVGSSSYKFTEYLLLGSTGTEVSELQKRLTSEGVYSGPITGKFGPLTEEAVKKYQSIHKLIPVGIVGVLTRTVLNNS